MIFYLQITVLLCLLYTYKTKMYIHNMLGTLVLLIISCNAMAMDDCKSNLVISLIAISILIIIYDFYKSIIRYKDTNNNNEIRV